MSLPTIEDIARNMESTVRAFPKEIEKFMKNEAKDLRKRMIAYAKSKVKKVTGNYFKGFKAGKKVYKWSDADYNVRVYNSAPHAHLIENGHRGLFWGHSTGWVPGKHIMENAMQQFTPEFEKHIENDLADFIVKELER